jgi:hypothetical protein
MLCWYAHLTGSDDLTVIPRKRKGESRMHVALLDAMSYGAIFIFGLVGIMGLSMERVLRK